LESIYFKGLNYYVMTYFSKLSVSYFGTIFKKKNVINKLDNRLI
jgi:hypothetical protein